MPTNELKKNCLATDLIDNVTHVSEDLKKIMPILAPAVQATEEQVCLYELEDFLIADFPPREMLLDPWLPSSGLTMVYAPRGVGKTFFSLSVGLAVASGTSFTKWKSPRPRPVVIIDGEMPSVALQERVAGLVAGQEIERCDIRFVTHDTQPDFQSLDLSRQTDQKILDPYLEGVALIIVDNISTLCRTGRENEAEGWLTVQGWALEQRAKGRSVLFVHHAGKGGDQRGSSRREDVLDTVVKLQRPAGFTPDLGSVFEVHFTKARGIFGEDVEPIEMTLANDSDGILTWSYRSVEDSTYKKVVSLANEGLKPKEIADELEVNKSTVSRHLKSGRESGDVS